ncbi:hypothetical protein [Anabaena sp. FACHB-1237]|uniref:hypothetical protein n=1 Tax=Anabaena sp. FACHB-1237 TaxID=2692769 RepID=UPI001F54CF66|nr:hypothetical protein [Anabaena sp. FACHB-1237]
MITQGLKPIESKRKVVVYCRVSSSSQKPELKNQISVMETFCLNRGGNSNLPIQEYRTG